MPPSTAAPKASSNTADTNTLITDRQANDLDKRLTILEARVGLAQFCDKPLETVDERLANIKLELNRKLANNNASTPRSKLAAAGNKNTSTLHDNQQNWTQINKLLKELDPGIGLTHQQQPLLYKRQQVLASSDELQVNFKELNKMLALLTKATRGDATNNGVGEQTSEDKKLKGGSQKTKKDDKGSDKKDETQDKTKAAASTTKSTSSTQELREDQVTQAPILTEHYAISPAEEARVNALRIKLKDLLDRSTKLQKDMHHYLECYFTAVTACSQKLVRADEKIATMAAE